MPHPEYLLWCPKGSMGCPPLNRTERKRDWSLLELKLDRLRINTKTSCAIFQSENLVIIQYAIYTIWQELVGSKYFLNLLVHLLLVTLSLVWDYNTEEVWRRDIYRLQCIFGSKVMRLRFLNAPAPGNFQFWSKKLRFPRCWDFPRI